MSILVDTNVLLRRAQVVSQFHLVSLDALAALVRARVTLCLVPQVIYEFWAAMTRPVEVNGLGIDVPEADRRVRELFRDFVLLRDERGIFGNWQKLVVDHSVKGKQSHDARLVAAMHRHGLKNLLTFNRGDFARFPSISVFAPDDILAGTIPQPQP
jgi:predicted nucleic acid-binding protein